MFTTRLQRPFLNSRLPVRRRPPPRSPTPKRSDRHVSDRLCARRGEIGARHGMQHFAEVAEHFGVSHDFARELASLFWASYHPTEGLVYYRCVRWQGLSASLPPSCH